MKRSLLCITFILFLFTGCATAKNTEVQNTGSEALNVLEGSGTSASKDLPIDITIASFDDEITWAYERYEHDLYSFELPENWQVVDGTEHDLVNGVFPVPPDTDMGNFRYSAHVAIEVLDSMTAGGRVPDFSSEDIQKEFFAAQIIQTYAKMGGLSDLEFSVWESEHSYVYIASFKRSNDWLSMYQTTYCADLMEIANVAGAEGLSLAWSR